MAVIGVVTFRLAPGTSDDQFLVADRRVQTEFAYHRPGIVRRTTARGADGTWIVVTLWESSADMQGAAADYGIVQRIPRETEARSDASEPTAGNGTGTSATGTFAAEDQRAGTSVGARIGEIGVEVGTLVAVVGCG